MRRLLVAAILCLSAAPALAASPTDAAYLRNEAQGSAYELAIARLASEHATRPDVRAYAATVVNDHEAYNAALRELAQTKDVALPPGMTPARQQQLDRMSSLTGPAFDTAFIREAQRINADDLRDSQQELRRTTDGDIRAFVARFNQVDRKHEAGARAVSRRAVAGGMPVIRPPATGATMPVIPPPSTGTMPVIVPPNTTIAK